jgi:hypothetical protein
VLVAAEDIERWRTDGYVIVEALLDGDELDRAREGLARLFPSWEDVDAGRATPPYFTHFPYLEPGVDLPALHPTLIDFAERALGGDVLLSHSEILSKYAGVGDHTQGLHQDYGNNSLIVPSLDDPDQVASITYLQDSTVEMGPTGVVGYGDAAPWQHVRAFAADEEPALYAKEVSALAPAGSTLFYTQRTLHRGTALRATTGARHTLHVAFQRRASTWAGWRSWSMRGNEPALGDLLCSLTVRQRTVLGFPAPGDPYWTPQSVLDVAARYPAMDMEPYAV